MRRLNNPAVRQKEKAFPSQGTLFRFRLTSRNERLVRSRGLEPPRLAAQEPESCVSTNFTTSAFSAKTERVLNRNFQQSQRFQNDFLYPLPSAGLKPILWLVL
jgi:hypothetical protein